MSYKTKDRNDAIMLIAQGKANLNDLPFYEQLASFNWISICKTNGVVDKIELTYAGKDLFNKLKKLR
jgi:hypothetical protein